MWWRMSIDLSMPRASLEVIEDIIFWIVGDGPPDDCMPIDIKQTHLISANMWCCGRLGNS